MFYLTPDFILVGDIDEDNPNSISKSELDNFTNSNIVEHWRFRDNVENIIPQSNLMVLPSYREGLPKSLIEAAACGRAVVTTDVPGCRDAITPNVTRALVKVKNIDSLTSTIQKLINNPQLREQYGNAGRQLAENHFNINNVVEMHMQLYKGN